MAGARSSLVFVLLGPLLASLACGREPAAETPVPDLSPRAAAVQRGTAWLLAHAHEMERTWALSLFEGMQRIRTDPELRETCRRILEERSQARLTHLPARLPAVVAVHPARLFDVLAELKRRRRMGEPYEKWVEQLRELLAAHGARGWPDVWLTQKLIMIHRLSEFGLSAPGSFEEVREEIRTLWREGDPEALVRDRSFMFALTHVFTTASGYFSHFVDPAGFEPETAMLRHAVGHYLTEGVPDDRRFLEIQAQVVSSLALQQLPEDEAVEAMVQRLLDAQNPDGSWGEDAGHHLKHATWVVLKALVDLEPALSGVQPFAHSSR